MCATCRLQGSLRKAFQVSYRRRQWLSQTGRSRQSPTENARTDEIRSGFSSAQTGQQLDGQFQDRAARGRYSGKPLAPQELLNKLDHSLETRLDSDDRSRTHHRHGRGSSHGLTREVNDRSRAVKIERVPSRGLDFLLSQPGLLKLWDRFRKVTASSYEPQPNDEQAVDILRAITRVPSHETLTECPEFKRRCFLVIRRICDTWTAAILTDSSRARAKPTPVEVLNAMTACTTENRQIYPSTLWQLATAAVRLRSTDAADADKAFSRCVSELMMAWDVTMRTKLSPGSGVNLQSSVALDWFYLPNHAQLAEVLQSQRRRRGPAQSSFAEALSMFVPEVTLLSEQAPESRSWKIDSYDYQSAALVTLDLLQQMRSRSEQTASTEEFEPWMSLIYNVFRSVGHPAPPPALSQKLQASEDRDYYKGVIERFTLSSDHASSGNKDARGIPQGRQPLDAEEVDDAARLNEAPEDMMPEQSNRPSVAVDEFTPASRFASICSKRLGRALEQENRSSTREVYGDVRQFVIRNPDIQLPMGLYEELLRTFLSLQSHKDAISVWNDMIKAGHRPTTKTYTIVMKGSQEIRDQSATVEAFWNRMRKAGLQPDHEAWTTRIFGMIRSRLSVDVAIKALDDMGQEWLAAARSAVARESASKGKKAKKDVTDVKTQDLLAKFPGDVNGVPRPDVTVVNSAISGLAAKADHMIPKVLSWGRLYGIEPDLRTYNVLLNVSMRHGLPTEAVKILRRMSEKGIEPDSDTWTVLLAAMFEGDSLKNLTSDEVEKRAVGFVEEVDRMHSVGLDEKGYNAIIDRLLKTYDRPSIAQKILDLMALKGIKPNAHTYTILATSYFQQSPPNFAALDALWARIASENVGYGAALDNVFYDRMIENYAQHHNAVGTKKMLFFLDRAEAEGKKTSWKALEFAARALWEAGDGSRLMQITERAFMMKEIQSNRSGFGDREFWKFLESIGMIRPDAVQRQKPTQS